MALVYDTTNSSRPAGIKRNPQLVLDNQSQDNHALAGLLTFAVLLMEDLGNGFETTDRCLQYPTHYIDRRVAHYNPPSKEPFRESRVLSPTQGVPLEQFEPWRRLLGQKIGVRNRETETITILTPPDLSHASGVICLDGTPTKELWELSVGCRLNHEKILAQEERTHYLAQVMKYEFIQTSADIKPYLSGASVKPEQDGALISQIAAQNQQLPHLISSKSAISKYKKAGVMEYVDDAHYYGNLKGSNQMKRVRLGVVVGSCHYGDNFVKKWSALAGYYAERGKEKGAELSYGCFGDKVLTHMREHETLQAIMRFGRDGNGARVFIHTSAVPDWVPRYATPEECHISTHTCAREGVIRALSELSTADTSTIAIHPAVTCSKQYVRRVLHELVASGYIKNRYRGPGYVWADLNLSSMSQFGFANYPE